MNSFRIGQQRAYRKLADQGSWACGTFAVAAVLIGFLLSSKQFQHWFLIPIALCGVLTAKEAVDWLSGRLDVFAPIGVFGIFGFFFFFLTPLLHVAWNVWMWEVVPPPDWRDWLGGMAILNAVGLVVFRLAVYACSDDRAPQPPRVTWVLDFRVFPAVAIATLGLSFLLQAWVYVRSGGIGAFVAAFQQAYQTNDDRFAGWGWIFMISESFPIVAACLMASWAQRRRIVPSVLQLAGCALLFFLLQIYFGGLRGSRLNTVEGIFWAAGMYHFFVHPIRRSTIFAGVLVLVGFMYVYGFYKDGANLSTVLQSSAAREAVEQKSHRSFNGLILGDLGRADVQAFLLYKAIDDPRSLRYTHGDTYLSGLMLFLPGRLRPTTLVAKEQISSDLIWGAGVYTPGVLWSTRIYGMAGEAILNFGYFAVPLAFLVLGVIVARLDHWIRSLRSQDARLLLAPFAVYLVCVWAVSSDFDNLVFSLIKQTFVLVLVLLFSTKRVTVRRRVAPRFEYLVPRVQ